MYELLMKGQSHLAMFDINRGNEGLYSVLWYNVAYLIATASFVGAYALHQFLGPPRFPRREVDLKIAERQRLLESENQRDAV